MEAAIEAGAEDVESDEESHTIYTAFEDLSDVAEALEASFGPAKSTDIVWRPKTHDAGHRRRGRDPDEAARRARRRGRRAERLRQLRDDRRGPGAPVGVGAPPGCPSTSAPVDGPDACNDHLSPGGSHADAPPVPRPAAARGWFPASGTWWSSPWCFGALALIGAGRARDARSPWRCASTPISLDPAMLPRLRAAHHPADAGGHGRVAASSPSPSGRWRPRAGGPRWC